jgi:TolB-like protein/Flp pilus assembly protein TadD
MTEDTNPAGQKPPSVDRLSQLWRRINEHKMVQWSVAYVALAYGIQHGVVLTSEAFDWPHAVTGISMLLLTLGLPLVITFAWYHGERASRRISGPELTIISILLVMSSLLFYVFVQPSAEVAAGARAAIQQAGVAAARSAAADPHGAISVAVMPFANLSSDKEQEFFSDGITDEIGTALAKIQDLRVVARQSAYRFKGGKEDARAIGQALSATHLLEGSVRKAGNRVRISAELVKADDGLRIWAENYDRDLTDVFAIQEDIARAIAASLRMPLGLKADENLVNNRTKSEASYEDYLRARALLRARNFQSVNEAAKLLEASVARDPGFASAWGLLGSAYLFIPRFDPVRQSGAAEKARPTVQSFLAKAEAAAKHAIQLDPKNADGYLALADLERDRGKFAASVEFASRAMALDPDNPDILNANSITLAQLGYLKQALPIRERLLALEPYVPVFKNNFATMLWTNGQTEEAVAVNRKPPAGAVAFYAYVAAEQGRYGEAADFVQKIRIDDAVLSAERDAAVRLLRAAPAKTASPQTLPQLGVFGGWVYFFVGAPERILEYPEGNIKIGSSGGMELVQLWAPVFAPVRKTERFKAFVRAAGMVDYWRAKGWPDRCHPVGATDFACD